MTDNLSRGERLLPETLGFQLIFLRQFPCDVNSPVPFVASRNPSVRAVHAAMLMTEPLAPEPGFVSLGAVLSKAPDFGKSVRIFKRLICQRYLTLEIRAFRISLGGARGTEIGKRCCTPDDPAFWETAGN